MTKAILPRTAQLGTVRVTVTRSIPGETFEELDALLEEYVAFKTQVEKVTNDFDARLRAISGPLCIDSLKAMGWYSRCGVMPDWIIDGFHHARNQGAENIKDGTQSVYYAIRQARTLALLLSKREGRE